MQPNPNAAVAPISHKRITIPKKAKRPRHLHRDLKNLGSGSPASYSRTTNRT